MPATSIQQLRPGRGRRSQTIATQQGGYSIGATVPQNNIQDIAIEATLRAAAIRNVHQDRSTQNPNGQTPPRIIPADLRVKIRQTRTGNLILFVVDASGSMGARKRMVAVKGAILSLLLDAYQKRDRVGLITFRGSGAKVLVPPTNSVELAERHLRQMPTGGRTPLLAGLQLLESVLRANSLRENRLTPLIILLTDGRANEGQTAHLRHTALTLAKKQITALVLDSEQGFVRLGQAQDLAAWLGAEYLPLDQLQADYISKQIRQRLKTKR